MTKGKLFVIESGSDGSGKATQTEILYKRLLAEGYNVRKITFPNYDSPACMPVKMYLSGEFGEKATDVNAYAASTLYAVDRFASFKKDWEKFYMSGGIVLMDRYTTSNMVHQASKLSDKEIGPYLDWLYDLEFEKLQLPKPDNVLFLDVHPDISLELMATRANKFTGEESKDIHESDAEYLLNCYSTSKKLAVDYGWDIIECTQNKEMKPVEKIHDVIYNIVVSNI